MHIHVYVPITPPQYFAIIFIRWWNVVINSPCGPICACILIIISLDRQQSMRDIAQFSIFFLFIFGSLWLSLARMIITQFRSIIYLYIDRMYFINLYERAVSRCFLIIIIAIIIIIWRPCNFPVAHIAHCHYIQLMHLVLYVPQYRPAISLGSATRTYCVDFTLRILLLTIPCTIQLLSILVQNRHINSLR